MRYSILRKDGYLHVEVVGRETAADVQEYLDAVVAESMRTGITRILMAVRASKPIFRVEQYRISQYFGLLAAYPEARIALVGDSAELRFAQQYVELLSRQRGAAVRAFSHEGEAVEWLTRAAPERDLPAPAKPSGSRRILVVEDNLDTARSLVMLLRELGHEVDFAVDGREALEFASRTNPEFVFLDLGLPHLDGFEVCARIKQDPRLAATRVIAVTAYAAEEHKERALAAGFDGFVTKPAGMDFFEDVLR